MAARVAAGKEAEVPKFIDYHAALPALPPEAAKAMAARVKAGKRDDHGVRALNVFIGKGEGWCLADAEDAAAVVRSHKAQGFPIQRSDVHEVTSLV